MVGSLLAALATVGPAAAAGESPGSESSQSTASGDAERTSTDTASRAVTESEPTSQTNIGNVMVTHRAQVPANQMRVAPMWCPATHPWVLQRVPSNVSPGLNIVDRESHETSISNPTYTVQSDGRTGITSEVRNNNFFVSRWTDLLLMCTNDPSYNSASLGIEGTVPELRNGLFIDHQLTLTGTGEPKIKSAAVTGLPSGLTLSETGKLTGTPTNLDPDREYILTVPIVNKFVLVTPQPATFSLTSTQDSAVVREHVSLIANEKYYPLLWCPTTHPFIKQTAPSNTSPGLWVDTESPRVKVFDVVYGWRDGRMTVQATMYHDDVWKIYSAQLALTCTNAPQSDPTR